MALMLGRAFLAFVIGGWCLAVLVLVLFCFGVSVLIRAV
jgi:hypothetical protein